MDCLTKGLLDLNRSSIDQSDSWLVSSGDAAVIETGSYQWLQSSDGYNLDCSDFIH